jgi:glycosyltransferase involved in cell wall biosynthesis
VVRNWSHVEPAPPFDRDAVRALHGWGDEEIVALHAGNMGAKQGLENVVAASRVAADRGSRVRFVLMGDGLRRRELQALDPNPHLQFLDPVPDGLFEQTLAAADVLLVNELPGLTEMSVPSKLTTYWATGRPVVAAVDRASTTAEEILVSGAGQLVEPAAPAALVESIESVVADPDRCRELGAAGQAFRREHLSPEAALDAFETVLLRASDRPLSRLGGVGAEDH